MSLAADSRRRDAIRAGLGAAAGALVAGPALAARAAAAVEPDGVLLRELIEQQLALTTAYEELARDSSPLEEEVRKAAELFARQEREHAEALTAAYEDLGERPPRQPDPDDVDGLAGAENQEDALELLQGMTEQAIATLNDGGERFRSPDLVRTSAQIVGCEAQHLVVIRQQLDSEPVPDAFSTGEPE